MRKRLGLWIALFLVTILISLYTTVYLLGPPSLNQRPITIYAQNGERLGSVYSDGQRVWQAIADINPDLIEATLAIEDQNFYQHRGFDLRRIGGAVLTNIRAGSLAEGASTITQQYARNLYLNAEKSWLRKGREAFYALRLETFYDKETILEGYLNTIYYGHGIYGVETASQFYFAKSSTELSHAEIALLVAIPNSPNANSPIKHFTRAKQQQERIIATLEQKELLTETEAYLAHQQVLDIVGEPIVNQHFGYIADLAITEASNLLGYPIPAGAAIYTEIVPEQQEALSQATLTHSGDLQVGAIVAVPATGAIQALIGGVDYFSSPYNRATQAKRMIGSTFKPILYYTALNNGYTAATTLQSEPTQFHLNDGSQYAPQNFNNQYAHNSVTLAQALAVSDNIYAIKTQLFLTPERVIEQSRELGITSELPAVPSLALGTASLSVSELVTAYSHFANGGHKVSPYLVKTVATVEGDLLYERTISLGEQILDEQVTFILNQLMTGMFDRNLSSYLSVTGGSISDQLSGDYAGKSGSTHVDSWMVGYNPERITGVWTGYDDNKPVHQSNAAKLIWRDAMEAAPDRIQGHSFITPPGIVAAYVDPTTGSLSTERSKLSRLMFFIEGTEPRQYSSVTDQQSK
ncbi:Membrane carboxypeptidase (penicillin-binding protein) [Amphibacillus marinus]|uniref:Membrane carboxypeptidase (Penicillin-binding protein) n=1 Tax=Amphibacillus marinus TaxID=872970 RepID=A0A1H8MZF5_9BACI|nr:transglycosylase domain-containing protein [Amphibacillus marinus]SEO22618.1 Membrane carboxypeptidase (penicillin-binding protein) [Amphibacillus marinus]